MNKKWGRKVGKPIDSVQVNTFQALVVERGIMRRSNRNFDIRPPRANPGHLTIFCPRGVGNLTFALPWGGEN